MKPPVDAPMSRAVIAGDVDAERVERVRELEAAAADPGVIRLPKRDLRGVVHQRSGLGHAHAVDVDVAGDQQRAGAFAGLRQPARDEQLIETGLWHCGRSVMPAIASERSTSAMPSEREPAADACAVQRVRGACDTRRREAT